MNRSQFIRTLGLVSAGTALGSTLVGCSTGRSVANMSEDNKDRAIPMFFKISLAEWSLHRSIFDGKLNHLDFPVKAKNDFGIEAVEYVNQFFKDKAEDRQYLSEMKKRCDDNGVRSLLIMCDGEGGLGVVDKKEREKAVDNHKKWVEAAKFLGCHSIRVNAYGEGSREEVARAATDGLRQLAAFAAPFGIHVIVENHGGYSSDGGWLAQVIAATEKPNCGTLPDFGNFCLVRREGECAESYDRYKGVAELMPFAKGVSAKTYDFDEKGNCIETDYSKMLPIVKDAKFNGFVGIEYEGNSLPEDDGIRATKALLERIGRQIS